MQALDLLHRRLWRDEGKGLAAFLEMARADIAGQPEAQALAYVLDLLEEAAEHLHSFKAEPRQGEAGATPFLYLASLAATGWIALRLTGLDNPRLAAAGRWWLSDLAPRAALEHARATQGSGRLEAFSAFTAR